MTKRTDGPSDEVRLRVFRRDRFICAYCGVTGSDAELEVDHIHPVAKGGSHHIANLVTSCRSCNQKKGSGELKRAPNVAGSQPTEGLVGLFLHTWKEGRISLQGHCIRQVGDVVLVQLFEWFLGEPSKVVAMRPEDLVDPDKCTLYHSCGAMNHAYENYERRRAGEQRRSKTTETRT